MSLGAWQETAARKADARTCASLAATADTPGPPRLGASRPALANMDSLPLFGLLEGLRAVEGPAELVEEEPACVCGG